MACRSLTASVWQIGPFSNRWIVGGILVQAIGQLAITYVPAMNSLFGTAPIGGGPWLRVGMVAVGLLVVVAVDKRVHRRLSGRGGRGLD